MTKTSVATLNTQKKIDNLETDYIKIKSIGSQSISERFPALTSIDSFTPGIKSIIKGIATHLNHASINQSGRNLQDSGEVTMGKILSQAKKVCRKKLLSC